MTSDLLGTPSAFAYRCLEYRWHSLLRHSQDRAYVEQAMATG
jgi:hypothetical protein